MKPLVSIIVPVYNVEKHLEKCIESIRNQTYANQEIILINDGSPDNSPRICDKYAGIDDRIKVIHKENGGISDARNVGIDAATGDYLVFLDSDDYIEKNMVEKAIDSIQATDADIAIWGYYADFVDKEEKLKNSVLWIQQAGLYSRSEMKDYPIDYKFINNLGYAWNKMYRTQLVKEKGFKFAKGISLVEDMLFNTQVLQLCNSIVLLDEPFVHYMQRPGVTLGAQFYENYFELKLMALAAINNLLRAWGVNDKIVQDLLASIGFDALKSNIRSLSAVDHYAKKQKIEYLDNLLSRAEAIQILENVNVEFLKDKILKKLMQKKQVNILLFGYKRLDQIKSVAEYLAPKSRAINSN